MFTVFSNHKGINENNLVALTATLQQAINYIISEIEQLTQEQIEELESDFELHTEERHIFIECVGDVKVITKDEDIEDVLLSEKSKKETQMMIDFANENKEFLKSFLKNF